LRIEIIGSVVGVERQFRLLEAARLLFLRALSLSRRRQPRIKTPLSILSTSTVVEKIDMVKRKGQKLSSRQHRATIEARATAT
jgi:hypothetical protein